MPPLAFRLTDLLIVLLVFGALALSDSPRSRSSRPRVDRGIPDTFTDPPGSPSVPSRTIAGRVIDTAGRPLQGAIVLIRSWPPGGATASVSVVRSGIDGTFQCVWSSREARTALRVTVTLAGFQPALRDIRPTDSSSSLTLTLLPGGA